jgi:hypothetical protein
MDIEELKKQIAQGASLDETAGFLCRKGTREDVARKARELGLTFRA